MTDIDEELAALYRSARAQEAPTRADRMAVQAGVAAALATTAAATSAQAAGSVATSQLVKVVTVGKIAVWLCAGAALGGVTSSVAWLLTSEPESAPQGSPIESSHVASRRASTKAPALSAAVQNVALTPPNSASSGSPSEQPPGASVRARGAPSASEEGEAKATASAAPSLLAESEGVQLVQQALASADAARALTLLDSQASQFRAGALAEERAALRVLALCAAGQLEAAETARQRFLGTYPHSPHEARVRGNCAKQ
jgi:hypothetical protein